MNFRAAIIVLLCATGFPMSAQIKSLEAKSRVTSNVAFDDFRTFALPTACDSQGRSYVKLPKASRGTVVPLLRLSSKGLLEAEFDTASALLNIFAVRPNGGVAMVRSDERGKFIENFGPDGKTESTIKLDPTPIAFFPLQIAVFPSGEILASGLQLHPGYKASAAIYDSAGHFVKQFALDGDAELERAIEAGDSRYTRTPGGGNEAVSRSVAITGDDGLVYLMRATSPATVYAISSSGEVVRKIVVSSPTTTGLPALELRVVKNKLALSFYRDCEGVLDHGCHGTIYRVVDATTGKRLADYSSEGDVAGPLACYAPDPDRFFIFSISSEPRHLEIIEAESK